MRTPKSIIRLPMNRRAFVKIGTLGAGGLGLSTYLRMAGAGAVERPKATSAIFVFLGGGPSHIDSFDPKPAASADVRGEFAPIQSSVPGLELCEHLPLLARGAERFALVRGVSHSLAAHELGTRYMNTGNRPLPSLEFPSYGSVAAKELPTPADLPPFVAVPSAPQKAGYLGVQYAPLETNSVPAPGQPFSVRGIAIGDGRSLAEVERRQSLLAGLDTTFDDYRAPSDLLVGLDRFDEQAFDIIRSNRAREAFDTSREPAELAGAFGSHGFGQSCLLAARLVEAGVRLVTVSFGGWDTHNENFPRLKDEKLPQLDQGLSALLSNLEAKGRLESTAVFVTGEFGRTPKVNNRAGRDHWAQAMFVLFAGGGVRGGQVIGASDSQGQGPASEGIPPENVAASFYHALGIDWTKEYHTHTGRPVKIVREGRVIDGLFG